jgi:voltage-gated potassium channel
MKDIRFRASTQRDLYRPMLRAGLLLLLIFAIGTTGYAIIGAPEQGLVDAIYMTVITLTTVGFGEIVDMSNNAAARMFTVVLLVAGVGAFLGFFSTLTAFVVEGSAQHLLWRKRMNKAVNRLSGHTIVCGGGHTGEHIVHELLATERPFVLIDADEERGRALMRQLDCEFPFVVGDATDDDALEAAGIARAERLVACISNDKDNLIVTVSARILNANLRIVSRCVDERVEDKIRKAGADAVVSPNRIGGLRMISEAMRPTAVNFLDQMLRGDEALRVESTLVEANSQLVGRTVAELKNTTSETTLLLALQHPDGRWVYAPSNDVVLAVGDSLIYLGRPGERRQIERAATVV